MPQITHSAPSVPPSCWQTCSHLVHTPLSKLCSHTAVSPASPSVANAASGIRLNAMHAIIRHARSFLSFIIACLLFPPPVSEAAAQSLAICLYQPLPRLHIQCYDTILTIYFQAHNNPKLLDIIKKTCFSDSKKLQKRYYRNASVTCFM